MVPITGSIRSTLPRASTRRRRPPPHPSAAVAAAAATIQFHHDCLLSDSYTFKNHHHLHLLVALSNRVRSRKKGAGGLVLTQPRVRSDLLSAQDWFWPGIVHLQCAFVL
ncbi:hypothetical protein Tco_1354786 [Tanacetum coccineum]